jgi:murein DD-endopeptidase MepM/ murein hydrolase activator NlpD
MRHLRRILGTTFLLMALQVLVPAAGWAQIDPCNPIPIPGLCQQPSPLPPVPIPVPTDPGDVLPGGGGGGGTGSGSGGGGAQGQGGALGGLTGNIGQGQGSGDLQGGPIGGAPQPVPVAEQQPQVPTGPFRVSSPNNSQALVDMLKGLERYGISLQDALLQVVGPFPVAGPAYWTDDWHACRDGCTRFHEGLDIFAPHGTPLVAPADGVVTQKVVGSLSGTSIEIQDANGVQYFYAHLSGWAEPINVGDPVELGQVLGYVGNTGNAISTPPHLHLEVQPGGIPVPPKPFVDRWLEIAELRAEQLIARTTGQPLPAGSNFRLTRLFDLAGGNQILEAGAQRLVALAGIQPSVSSLELAERVLGQMAYEIDWAGQTDAQLVRLARRYASLVGAQDLSGASPWAPLGTTTGAVPAGEVPAVASLPEQGD